MNFKLLELITHSSMDEIGFKEDRDHDDPRGSFWRFENDKFLILIDAWGDVTLNRKNPDTDQLTITVETLFDLQCIVDWIED